MTGAEQGFLLLSSHLADPERKPLTQAQLRLLAQRVQCLVRRDPGDQLTDQDLIAIGYSPKWADKILSLLAQKEQLEWYLKEARRRDCYALARITPAYPDILKRKLGWDSPGCLWIKGDPSVLQLPAVSLVGSRELNEENRAFAAEAGKQAALQGYVLVSGNARGADIVAQNACLEWGGKVISVVADALQDHNLRENVLYVSEDGFELPFTTARALSRNRIIHSLGKLTLVAQSALGKGGTWDGTLHNLRKQLSPVFCFDDGSRGIRELAQMGAVLIGPEQLEDLDGLCGYQLNFIDQ